MEGALGPISATIEGATMARKTGAIRPWLALGLVLTAGAFLLSGCATPQKGASGGAASGAASARPGPKTIGELQAFIKSKYAAEPWYMAIREIRFQTKFGRPVITVYVPDEPLPPNSQGFDNDRAILDAIEESGQAFANNYETVNAYGTRLSSSEAAFAPIPALKPLAALPKPTNPAELKTWLDGQWGPKGADPLKGEAWFDTLMAAPMSVKEEPGGNVLLIQAGLPWTAQGTEMHTSIMYALGLAGADFVTWQKALYADASKNGSMDAMKYEFPYK
jgi:hypothetical protein